MINVATIPDKESRHNSDHQFSKHHDDHRSSRRNEEHRSSRRNDNHRSVDYRDRKYEIREDSRDSDVEANGKRKASSREKIGNRYYGEPERTRRTPSRSERWIFWLRGLEARIQGRSRKKRRNGNVKRINGEPKWKDRRWKLRWKHFKKFVEEKLK